MYRDMTRGSITRGLLLFALPMAAGDPCGAGLCAGGAVGINGIWAAIPIGWFFDKPKGGAAKLNCTPFVGQYGMLSNKWGVFICQREYHRIKLKLNGLNPVQYRIQTVQAA